VLSTIFYLIGPADNSIFGNKTFFSKVFRLGLVFGFLAFLVFSDKRRAGPLHQPLTWRTRWFLVKVFFL